MFNKANRTNIMSMQRQATSIIQSFFAKYNSLVGKPVFTVNSDKVIVQLFYSFGGPEGASTDSITNPSITALGDALTRC
jgi:hypothetical protein